VPCHSSPPGLIRQLFGLLLYGSKSKLETFHTEPLTYITLTHGVLGAVMFGWGATLLLVLFGPFRRGSVEAWRTLIIALLAWFIPDTPYSLSTGFWQNAALNMVFALMVAPALAATKGFMNEERA
jgi:hypothetical protein